MTIGEAYLNELILESEVTRRYLALVPFDKKDFKPAEKSEKLGRLAIHVAEITGWWTACLESVFKILLIIKSGKPCRPL